MKTFPLAFKAAAALLITGAAAGFIGRAEAGGPYVQREARDGLVVVELFTSQGCSSCPPADQLQLELTGRADVLPLTFPVAYWDYLGWRDTLARPAFSDRQMAYAKRSKKGRVFTPQMVIAGTMSVVGSRREDVLKEISAVAPGARSAVPIAVFAGADQVEVVLPDRPAALSASKSGTATVWLFPFTAIETVHIGGGENRGRSIRYAHVVRNVVSLGTWEGPAERFSYQLTERERGLHGYAVALQADELGPILGAAVTTEKSTARQNVSPEPPIGGDPLTVDLRR